MYSESISNGFDDIFERNLNLKMSILCKFSQVWRKQRNDLKERSQFLKTIDLDHILLKYDDYNS